MTRFILLLAVVVLADSMPALGQYYRPPASVEITWKAPENTGVRKLSTFRIVPKSYSAAVISNALALASLRLSDRMPGTNLCFQDRRDQFWTRSLIFDRQGEIAFHQRTDLSGLAQDVPDDKTIAEFAWSGILKLGISREQLIESTRRVFSCEKNGSGQKNKSEICCRGILLNRKLDGVEFYTNGEDIRGGFVIDYESHRRMRGFSLIWPALEPAGNCELPNHKQLTDWLKAGKSVLSLRKDGTLDQAQLTELNEAKILTVIKETLYYTSLSQDGQDTVAPFMDLETIGAIDSKTIPCHLLCPLFDTTKP